MRTLSVFAVFFAGVLTLNAQSKKIIHQTFMVEDYQQLNIDLYEKDYEVVFWQGNTVLTETQITLENGLKHLLDFHVDSLSRYEIVESNEDLELTLSSFDQKRMTIAIKYKGSELYPNEIVNIKIYIPSVFEAAGEHVFIRKEN